MKVPRSIILLFYQCLVLGSSKSSELFKVVKSSRGIVAADDGRCSKVGAAILREGGHAVDAAVATALCLGVVNPNASGLGGGAFMVVRSASSTSQALAFDMRETAPLAAPQNKPKVRRGTLTMGVPGELAGLHEAWKKYGRLSWKTLFQPAIKLAKNGFEILPYLGIKIKEHEHLIKRDPGLREVFAPNGTVLQIGDIFYNVKLAESLETIAEQGPEAFYNGTIAENLVKDVQKKGGILTVEDLRNYKVKVTQALAVDRMGFRILGMPPPSSGTLGIAMILNILNNYGSFKAVEGPLGLHRLIEAMKHMFAVRMNLGDPDFVNITRYMSDMTSPSFAKEIWHKIYDNTTFPPEYYKNRWSQLQEKGTSHICIVDAERNAVSLTTSINYSFGAAVLSPSTGIVLNNCIIDFSNATEISSGKLPPAPANFVQPGKRPLSSMTPLLILKDNQLVGLIGGSGGLTIIPAVAQVFLNLFVMGIDPLTAVQSPRVYLEVIPNVVSYENLTALDGEHIELSEGKRIFLEKRGHQVKPLGLGQAAICQIIVQSFECRGRKIANTFYGTLTAVSDPRKDGRPAAI